MSDGSYMTFERFGRSYHLKVEKAEDLENVLTLNEAHWVATNAPVEMVKCDSTFLQFVDSEKDGRIMCHEVKEAICWLLAALRDRTGITGRSRSVRLDAVDGDSPEGREVLDAAEEVLKRRGRGQNDVYEFTLEQVRQFKTEVEATPVSEAGVVLGGAAKSAEVRQFILDIIATVGGVAHPSGGQGVDLAGLTSFSENARAYLDWYARGQIPDGENKSDIMPLGADTAGAYAVFSSVRGKLDQFFAQCLALTLDERFGQRMGWTQSELGELDFDDVSVIDQVLKKAPLAKARASQVLDFKEKINPYYAGMIEDFQARVMGPVLGKGGPTLSAEQWQQIKSFFSAHQSWLKGKGGAVVEPLGVEKLQQYLDERFANAVRSLVSESTRTAKLLDKVRLLEKLALYQAYMLEFVNNFVSFPQLYNVNSRAMFEMGSLVMDGRRFNLAVRTGDRAVHKAVAGSSNMYVLYVEIVSLNAGKAEVVVPVTSGGKGNLCVGKRGVFYDILGREYDARVVDIIENPISFKEALISPFQRLGRLVAGKIESLAATAEKKLDTAASSAVDQVATQPATAQGQQAGVSRAGLLMGAGVTVAALGSSLAYITKTLTAIHPWRIAAGVLGAVLAVMLPISIIAMVKLRKRDLSAILEGSGWGINARMRLTHKQSRFFTERPRYPRGSKGIRYLPWGLLVLLLVLLGAVCCGLYLFKSRRSAPENSDSKPPAVATVEKGSIQ